MPTSSVSSKHLTEPGWLEHSSTVYQAGWWPMAPLVLDKVRAFLQGNGLQAETERLYQQLEVLQVIEAQDALESIQVELKNGIAIQIGSDGVYLLELVGEALSRAGTLLSQFETEVWRPALKLVAPIQTTALDTVSPQTTSNWPVWVRTDQPQLFELPASLGPIQDSHQEGSVRLLMTDSHVFVVSPESQADQVQTVIEWWLIKQALQQALAHLSTNLDTIQERSTTLQQRTQIRQGQIGALRQAIYSLQLELLPLDSLLSQISLLLSRRVSLSQDGLFGHLSPVDISQNLLATTHYLKDQRTTMERGLTELEQLYAGVTTRVKQWHMSMLGFFVIIAMVSIILNWLKAVAFPDLALSWFGGILVILLLAGVIQALVFFLSQRRNYRVQIRNSSKIGR